MESSCKNNIEVKGPRYFHLTKSKEPIFYDIILVQNPVIVIYNKLWSFIIYRYLSFYLCMCVYFNRIVFTITERTSSFIQYFYLLSLDTPEVQSTPPAVQPYEYTVYTNVYTYFRTLIYI